MSGSASSTPCAGSSGCRTGSAHQRRSAEHDCGFGTTVTGLLGFTAQPRRLPPSGPQSVNVSITVALADKREFAAPLCVGCAAIMPATRKRTSVVPDASLDRPKQKPAASSRPPAALAKRPAKKQGSGARPPAADESGAKQAKAVAVEIPASRPSASGAAPEIRVRRMHRRDINRTWEFVKLVFRGVNRQTVEYQRPRSKARFEEQYEEEGVEQMLFEVDGDIVGYAECAGEVLGSDNWINPRYFESRDMRPLFVEELATHPDYQGMGIGSFMIEQLLHLARVRGCTHLVLEVAENNEGALTFYRKRTFYKLDSKVFLAKKVASAPELLPPRKLPQRRPRS